MTKHNYGILLTFVLCGCATDRRLGGETAHDPDSSGAGSTSAGSTSAGLSGVNTGGKSLGGIDATDPVEGTTAPTAGASTGTGTGARSSATAGGGTAASTANATGGTANGGTLDAGTGGRLLSGSGGTGGAPMSNSASTRASGGSTVVIGGASTGGAFNTSTGGASTGGASTGGASNTSNGGASTGGASNTSNGGASAGGASSGGAGSCVPVCTLYGAPCCLWQTSCLGPTGGCTIDVLTSTVGTTYEYADLEAKVAALPQDVSVSLTEQDFSWVAADPWAAQRYELHLTEAAAARYGATLDNVRDTTAFRVSCGGNPLFVGVVYLIYGAAALRTPVLHHARENGVVVLRLGAVQGGWLFGPSNDCGTPCQRIDRLELRGTFCRLGVMHELAPDARPLNP